MRAVRWFGLCWRGASFDLITERKRAAKQQEGLQSSKKGCKAARRAAKQQEGLQSSKKGCKAKELAMSRSDVRFCGSPEHWPSRRGFLAASGLLAANMAGVGVFSQRAFAEEVKRSGKRVIMLWLAGGASQLETWDPK